MGASLKKLHGGPTLIRTVPAYEAAPVEETSNHCVLFKLPLITEEERNPCSQIIPSGTNKEVFVEMPNSLSNTKHWESICKVLSEEIKTFDDLRGAILSYAKVPEVNSHFQGLENYIENELNAEERANLFKNLLPKISSLALSLPEIVTRAVPRLQANSTSSISLSKKQISCLLANAFLCTFPHENFKGHDCGYGTYPDFNFQRLFASTETVTEKLKCIFNYFQRLTSEEPVGVVTFTRQHVPEEKKPRFENSDLPLSSMDVKKDGYIEEAEGLLQMDFADEYIGGMILTEGCVQEEIRFLYCPELIVARLFTDKLEKNEAVLVNGVEQYNYGRGYSWSLKWLGNYQDNTQMDSFQRKKCELVAIDAICFSGNPKAQYQPSNIMRDIHKAYAGFKPIDGAKGPLPAVASGNWGCGVFGGNPQLKGLLQLVAASMAGRSLTYYTFGNQSLAQDLCGMHKYLTEKKVTIGTLVTILNSYECLSGKDGKDLYDFIRQRVEAK